MSKLHDAARAGDLTTLDAAIAEGEDLDAQDMHKRTPLHLAAWYVLLVRLIMDRKNIHVRVTRIEHHFASQS